VRARPRALARRERLAALLRESRRVKNSHVIFSDDEGRGVVGAARAAGLPHRDRHVLRYAPDGRSSPRSATWRRTARPRRLGRLVGRWDDIVEGRPGEYRVRLMKNHEGTDCAYPAGAPPDGAFVTTTYGHWTAGSALDRERPLHPGGFDAKASARDRRPKR